MKNAFLLAVLAFVAVGCDDPNRIDPPRKEAVVQVLTNDWTVIAVESDGSVVTEAKNGKRHKAGVRESLRVGDKVVLEITFEQTRRYSGGPILLPSAQPTNITAIAKR
jgi:hypothetical protein